MRHFDYLKDYSNSYELEGIVTKIKSDLIKLKTYGKDYGLSEENLNYYIGHIKQVLELKKFPDISRIINQELLSNENLEYTFEHNKYKEDASLTGVEFQKTINNIFEVEEAYRKLVSRIWDKSLTDINSFKNGDDFKLVVHSSHSSLPSSLPGTKGYIDNVYRNGEYISCSLLTGKQMDMFNSNIGLSFDVDNDNYICASDFDCVTHTSQIPTIRSVKKINNKYVDVGFSYSKDANVSTLMLPNEIEELNIKKCIEVNGEPLNNTNGKIINEVVIDKQTSKVNGIILMTNGCDFLIDEFATALEMQRMYNVPIKVINKSIYREKQNLSPFTETDYQSFNEKLKDSNSFPMLNNFNNEQLFDFINQYRSIVLDQGLYKEEIRKEIEDLLNNKIVNNKIY